MEHTILLENTSGMEKKVILEIVSQPFSKCIEGNHQNFLAKCACNYTIHLLKVSLIFNMQSKCIDHCSA